MTTLYRKYRPASFASVSGQEHIVTTLQNEIALGKIAQAYLFSGPRGVGKTTLARLLAKAINCTDRPEGKSEPCNACSSCNDINGGRHIDVIEIDAASHTGVDNVRENIIENAEFKPTRARYKVFIIDEVHMLSTSAFNALLKTLEEPPAHVVFILATTELHKLPATVISRCQRFTFKKIPAVEMLERLKTICADEKIKVDTDVLERIILKSEGGLRDAESLLGQIMSLNLKKITAEDAEPILPTAQTESVLTFLESLTNRNSAAAISLLAGLIADGVALDQFAIEILDALRAIMVLQAGAGDDNLIEFGPDAQKKLHTLAKMFTQLEVIFLLESLLRRRLDIKNSPLPQLPLELLAIEFSVRGATATPAEPTTGAVSTLANNNTPKVEPAPPKPTAETKTHPIRDSIKSAISTISGKHPVKTTVADIEPKWNEIVAKVSTKNHSLNFILGMAKIKEIAGDTLVISLPYSLHKEKLLEAKNRKIIEDCLADLFAEKIFIACEVTEKTTVEPPELESLAMEFGGEIVN